MPTPAKPGGAARAGAGSRVCAGLAPAYGPTLLDATYRSDMCGKAVCTPAQTIPAGNHLPGIARNMGYASLAFAPPEGWHAGAELRYMSDIQANDANSAQAPATPWPA